MTEVEEAALKGDLKQKQKQTSEVVDIDAMIEDQDSKQGDATAGPSYGATVLAGLGDDANELKECPICIDVMDHPVLAPICMHQW